MMASSSHLNPLALLSTNCRRSPLMLLGLAICLSVLASQTGLGQATRLTEQEIRAFRQRCTYRIMHCIQDCYNGGLLRAHGYTALHKCFCYCPAGYWGYCCEMIRWGRGKRSVAAQLEQDVPANAANPLLRYFKDQQESQFVDASALFAVPDSQALETIAKYAAKVPANIAANWNETLRSYQRDLRRDALRSPSRASTLKAAMKRILHLIHAPSPSN